MQNAMACCWSENEAADMYFQAIKSNREKLESVLYPLPWGYLQKSGCIVEELESLKKLPGKRAVGKVVDLVLEKGNIDTFTAFSKAIYSMKARDGKDIFPFADSIGGIPVTVPKKGEPVHKHQLVPTIVLLQYCGPLLHTEASQLSDKPLVLWLVPSKRECDSVISTIDCRREGYVRTVGAYTCQVQPPPLAFFYNKD